MAEDRAAKLPSLCPSTGLTWHVAGLVFMGVTFLDAPDMERLRQVCREEARNEFLLMVAPLRLPGGMGSLVNPIAVL